MASHPCPICEKPVGERNINAHLDSGCQEFFESEDSQPRSQPPTSTQTPAKSVASFFQKPTPNKFETSSSAAVKPGAPSASQAPQTPGPPAWSQPPTGTTSTFAKPIQDVPEPAANPLKRLSDPAVEQENCNDYDQRPVKRAKVNHLEKAAPLAERLRPKSLDEVCGQELVGPNGVLRGLIEAGRVPSMILWGSPGSGKTTIARLIANAAGTRFVEVNSASTGVAECKKLFAQAQSELGLTGRKTIMFCDEIHRFSRSQQDVLLGPVEAGVVTLIGATTSNPSFSLTGALLSRCRTFVLAKLSDSDISTILQRAVEAEKKRSHATREEDGNSEAIHDTEDPTNATLHSTSD